MDGLGMASPESSREMRGHGGGEKCKLKTAEADILTNVITSQ